MLNQLDTPNSSTGPSWPDNLRDEVLAHSLELDEQRHVEVLQSGSFARPGDEKFRSSAKKPREKPGPAPPRGNKDRLDSRTTVLWWGPVIVVERLPHP